MKLHEELFSFIEKSPSPYHTVAHTAEQLRAAGFIPLSENDVWHLTEGGKYYVVRDGSSLIAFIYRKDPRGFLISAAHTDSPSFCVKSHAERTSAGAYVTLETEKYGGMMYYTWFDRPLSVAGRLMVRTAHGAETRLVAPARDLCVIPSLAIHMNRAVNDGFKANPAVDLLPLFGTGTPDGTLSALLAAQAGCAPEDILASDLYLCTREVGRVFGGKEEFILAPRLDDLGCVFACLKGFLSAKTPAGLSPVLALFDNEEVGSSTKQGAASTFLSDVLHRAAGEGYPTALAGSFMVSADNAHAKHPNHPELCDPDHAPVVNGGVVVKFNAAQHYATDALSCAVFEEICRRADVPTQKYYNRADMPGGSTLGSISDTCVSVPTVDIGMPQLAMHSAVESAGVTDVTSITDAMRAFYASDLTLRDGTFILG